MSLPPGFLDELRNRLSITDVVGRKVMWDKRKSQPAKGDMWAPCPFHQEKTASFHVDDKKGFYYCFGCHAKGDAIGFVKDTENVGFMEAVEILAREAGMEVPKQDPRAQQEADRRKLLTGVMEEALKFYRMQLQSAAAREAREYLSRRGLSAEVIARWQIGFAPPGWDNLRNALDAKGVSRELQMEAGLVKASDRGRDPYDVFRNRILFPITDARGQVVAFGGRAMDPADNAKYLNSPETPLFDKGRTLFNLKRARDASSKHTLVVAEGYMDVIALDGAGFHAAVAPLGTAITETQLQMMWRMSPEPVIALDGDVAGQHAAARLIDLALPHIGPGRSLRFAMMPAGKDPDDLLREGGAGAVRAVLEGAMPLVQMLWRRETEGHPLDTPEQKAALDQRLREAIGRISDPGLRSHYGQAIKDMRWQAFRPQPRKSGGSGANWRKKSAPVLSDTKRSRLVMENDADRHLRESVILATLVSTPEVLPEFEHQLDELECHDRRARKLRDALIHSGGDARALMDEISHLIGEDAVRALLCDPHVAISPGVRNAGNAEIARQCLHEEFGKLHAALLLRHELEHAIEDLQSLPDEGITWRLSEAARSREAALRQRGGEQIDFEKGANGAPVRRDEREAFDALLETIRFSKEKRR